MVSSPTEYFTIVGPYKLLINVTGQHMIRLSPDFTAQKIVKGLVGWRWKFILDVKSFW